jgi:6-phosphogluconolactonase (cycloisomerase 2 family)
VLGHGRYRRHGGHGRYRRWPDCVHPIRLTVDPSGHFAYVANQASDNVSQYRIGADGTLSPLVPDEVPAGTTPYAVTTVGGFE